ncbi:hypothetical protein [Nonomuraea sp. NPDC003754]
MTLARLVAVCAAWGVFWGSWSALLPAVQAQVGASDADLGVALAGVPAGAIPAMALTSRLVRGRERAALAVTTVLFAVAVSLVGLVGSPLALGLALVGLGATSGAFDIALNTATGRAERESGRRLFQPVHAAFPVAVIVAAPATGLARSLGYGPAQVLAVVAVLVLACAVFAAGLALGRGVQPVAESGRHGAWRHAVVLGALAAGALVIENSVEQWSVLLLEDHLAAPTLLASAAPAVYMGALTAGRLVAQALPRLGLRTLYLVAGLGGGGGIALAGLAPVAWLSLAGFGLTGLALGPLVPAMLSRAAVGDEDGALVSAVSTFSYAGFVASPLLVAALSAAFSLPVALALLGVLAVPLLGIYLTDRSR